MLDYNNYSIGKLENLKDIFIVSYVIIDEFYKGFIPDKVKGRRNESQSKLSDSEIITINIVGKLLTIDSENTWFNFVKIILEIYSLKYVIEADLIGIKEIYTQQFMKSKANFF